MASNDKPTLPFSRQDGEPSDLRLPQAPKLAGASPVGDIACPLGPNMSPHLTTPHWGNHAMARDEGDEDADTPFSLASAGFASAGLGGLSGGLLGGLGSMNEWAWEMGSEAGSVPSAWSKPSTVHSRVSMISSANGDGLIPGLVDGQRLSSVKPCSVPTAGGKVVVSLRKEVPQGYWTSLSVVLVNGPVQQRLTPTGIKKGKKLCIEVPAGMQPGDYDVRLSFGEKIIHGAIPLSIRDGDFSEEDEDPFDG
ncbi:unnamed protein product [Polarella glacialis]|uniref:Uncharacterized protein n=1 Tax=Polarella glacialis TaxID=89957 RepID=A0A813K2A8_POLGL|nr:unnamed protein product [Polarella glacialis]|mmetsp:Transcript_20423/g.36276  ORF Transcript_20423/g.36276 Transcript_20423/m.36276 type:complete len:251 (-) Transcript_20423:107-859(-)|eukprot:CAMPEP_0115072280 /NCGR_PEP_ID=MMETSP0227-20121206/14140_1 /TAXON_ID=89957 /ORGANISM="Polarella glacialis, Strain CCMP 1383" /LENGTH=250 /DNA_ID=CAMNT_0002459005 /DNA_START=53 /DNA_END=805 /DNA_ORIENTATION=+